MEQDRVFEIAYLADYPAFAGNVSRWLYDEFVHPDNEELAYTEFHSIFTTNSKTGFPIRIVALCGGECVGTVTVIDNDFESRSYTPWLGGLYVEKAHRNRGIGRKLVEKAKQIAANSGYKEIYLNTETAGEYYKKLGWKYVESCPNESGRICGIYRFDL